MAREHIVLSCRLFGYVVFEFCGMNEIIEFSRIRKSKLHSFWSLKAYNVNLGSKFHMWWLNPFVVCASANLFSFSLITIVWL